MNENVFSLEGIIMGLFLHGYLNYICILFRINDMQSIYSIYYLSSIQLLRKNANFIERLSN